MRHKQGAPPAIFAKTISAFCPRLVRLLDSNSDINFLTEDSPIPVWAKARRLTRLPLGTSPPPQRLPKKHAYPAAQRTPNPTVGYSKLTRTHVIRRQAWGKPHFRKHISKITKAL